MSIISAISLIPKSKWFAPLAICAAVALAVLIGIAIPVAAANMIQGRELIILIGLLGVWPFVYVSFKHYDALVFLAFCLFGFVQIEPAPVDALIAPLLIIGFLTGRFSFKQLSSSAPVHTAILIFVLINFISLLMLPVISFGSLRYVAISFYMVVIFYFLKLYITDEKTMRIALFGYTVSALVSVILVYSGFLGLTAEGLFVSQTRGTGFFKDSNVYGPFLIPVILFLLDEIWHPHFIKGHKFLKALLIIMLTGGLFLSFSRAAWGSLIATIGIYFLLHSHQLTWRIISRLIFIIGAAILALIALVIALDLTDFLLWRANVFQSYDSERFRAQYDGIRIGLTYLFGIGPGQLDTQYFAPHSLYIRVFGEHGVFGFIALFSCIAYLMGAVFLYLLKSDAKVLGLSPRVVFAVAVGSMLNSFLVGTLHWRHFWFVLGLLWIVAGFYFRSNEIFLRKPVEYFSENYEN